MLRTLGGRNERASAGQASAICACGSAVVQVRVSFVKQSASCGAHPQPREPLLLSLGGDVRRLPRPGALHHKLPAALHLATRPRAAELTASMHSMVDGRLSVPRAHVHTRRASARPCVQLRNGASRARDGPMSGKELQSKLAG